MDGIRLEVSGPVATIVLDRPPVNALSRAMIASLIAAVKEVDRRDDIRVAILTGAGRCFSAGIDLKEQLASLETGAPGPEALGPALYDALLNGAKPLVAALNGPALGAGVGMAASCNILVACDIAVMGLPEIDVGALGGARHAMRLLGHSTVNRMLLTGHRIAPQELARRGVVEACLPADALMPYARTIADEIASKSPAAIALAKECLSSVETMSVLDGYVFESERSRRLGAAPEARALMRGFLDGRRS